MWPRGVMPLLVVPHGIYRIKNFASGLPRAGFRKRGHKSGVVGAGQGHHAGITVGVGCHPRTALVRRAAGGNEMNFVQMETPLCGSRHGKMADVNGIECSAEKRDAPLANLFPGNAVRFRRRGAQRSAFRRALRGVRATLRRTTGTAAKGATGAGASFTSGCG